ncbi:hypothetical protein HYG86_09120 [Alkalicella caledoniensis]|uniref:Uncharacterized protein n=1 Tax=Alkalicella caledoniensis TaxID=2731377 RepID=A0A7G9W8B0_ALKCA|nr:hypothetical protein [Alkalicella caledoniensis]QNO14922.1 hypothetical protein HYG86_09120 [Alkalicella caledoniensis]
MEKILTIDGRQVKFKSTGAFLLKYKAQFKRDALKDMLKLLEVYDEETKQVKDMDVLDLELFYNITWSLAKCADPTLPPAIDWLDTFSEFPLMDVIPEIIDLVLSCISSTVDSKKK